MSVPPPSLRRALLAHHPGRGKLYAPELQAAVVGFAEGRRGEGASWKEIATELGLRFETVRHWSLKDGGGPRIKRVEVVDDSAECTAGLCIVWPSGHRLERLTVQDAIAILRALA
jgi:hypothetical protein